MQLVRDRIAPAQFILIRNYIKPIFCKELKLGSFAMFFDRIADQVKSKELQIPLPRLTASSILTLPAARFLGWEYGSLRLRLIFSKCAQGYDAFTSHLKFVRAGNAHWHIHKSTDGMRHILVDNALAASGDCLLELLRLRSGGQVSDHPASTKAPQVCHLQTGASHQRTLFYPPRASVWYGAPASVLSGSLRKQSE